MELICSYEEEMGDNSEEISALQKNIDYEFLRKDLSKIVRAIAVVSERLTHIVGGMRNFSHMDEKARQPADLHECIDSPLLILEDQLKYSIELENL